MRNQASVLNAYLTALLCHKTDFSLLSQEFIHSLSKLFLPLCLAPGIVRLV